MSTLPTPRRHSLEHRRRPGHVALLPILWIVVRASRVAGLPASQHDLFLLLQTIFYINFALLVFNILPIYPLDGSQILRSLLWFVMGRARSLMVATILGLDRSIRVHRSRRGPRIIVDRSHRCLRLCGTAGPDFNTLAFCAHVQTAPARRIFLSHLQFRPSAWRLLEMQSVRPNLRHFRNRSSLSRLPRSVPCHTMPRLRPPALPAGLGISRTRRRCRFYFLYRLANSANKSLLCLTSAFSIGSIIRSTRYSSVFQVSVETSHFNFPVSVMWFCQNLEV